MWLSDHALWNWFEPFRLFTSCLLALLLNPFTLWTDPFPLLVDPFVREFRKPFRESERAGKPSKLVLGRGSTYKSCVGKLKSLLLLRVSLSLMFVHLVLLFLGFIIGTNSKSLPVLSGRRGMGRWFLITSDPGCSGLGLRTAPLIRMIEACDLARRGIARRAGDVSWGVGRGGAASAGR